MPPHGAKARRLPVRGERVQALVLETVGVEFVVQPDAAPFLAEGQRDSARFGAQVDSFGALRSAVAAGGTGHISREAFRMHAHEGHGAPGGEDDGDVLPPWASPLKLIIRAGRHRRRREGRRQGPAQAQSPKPKAQANFTDPDSRIMKNSDGACIQATAPRPSSMKSTRSSPQPT
ncbi:hypothetical protein GCM10018793_59860 [Streptomyces sulfonofaciens]|uniref:Uncharacterized protein n=1 Tax=Streptomyces sulfonofaciens TaxID=68272 RepID=A0A919GMQ0_9ACTN|nr:hypothetical protein GCM10018793_59860 [Streptomyces sulfonofaciens]